MSTLAFAGTALPADDFFGVIIAVLLAAYLVTILIRQGRTYMSLASWLQIVFFLLLLAISAPLLGHCMAKVYANEKAPGDKVFLPIERFVYQVCRIDPEAEQRWGT